MSANLKDRIKRNRDRQKKFVDKDEDENEVGVEDESMIIQKKNIQKKQEDAYDPKQLKQNMINHENHENQKSYKNNLINFGDQDDYEQTEVFQNQKEQEKQQEQKSKQKGNVKKRERGRREKKQIVQSDEDENIKEQPNISQNENFSALEQDYSTMGLQVTEQPLRKEQIKREIKYQKPRQQQQEQQIGEGEPEEDEQSEQKREQKQGQKLKDPLQLKPKNHNYIFMHTIMNKAGYNKQERREAVYAPLRQGQSSFVYFKRYQSGFSQYYQVIGEDQRPILFCENQRGCIGCNYYISLTKEMDKNNASYVGKLRGNASGSIYQLYDNGIQPTGSLDRSNFRVSMAFIEYQSNFLGMNGPRRLKATIPNVKNREDFDMYKLAEDQCLTNFQSPIVVKLKNKQPKWNERLKSYALNFGGRVKQASIKNFILIKEGEENEQQIKNLLIFGKIDQSSFALEFHHPFSLFQAFGIAMSEFDFKLKCE